MDFPHCSIIRGKTHDNDKYKKGQGNEDGEEPMSDYVAKGVQDKIVELLQEAGVEFKFEQDETEELAEDVGMNMA